MRTLESTKFSVVERVTTNDVTYLNFGEIITDIEKGEWKKPVNDCRKILYANQSVSDYVQRKKAYKQAKLGLPAFLTSVRCLTKAGSVLFEDKFEKYLYYIVLDFDGFSEGRHSIGLQEAKRQLAKNPFVHLVFESPSGDGLKVGIRLEFPNVDPAQLQAGVVEEKFLKHLHEKLAYDQLKAYFFNEYGLVADDSCRNLFRCCFLSYDPKLHHNPDAQPFVVDTKVKGATPKKKSTTSKKKGDSLETLLKGVSEGQRNATCFRIACLLRKRGCDEEEITQKCQQFADNCQPPLDYDEVDQCIESSANYFDLPVICITKGKNNEVINQVIDNLKTKRICFVTTTSQLVVVNNDGSGLIPLDVKGIQYLLDEQIIFTVLGKDEESEPGIVSCPIWLAQALLSPVVNQVLPKLKGFTTVPIVHPDLSVITDNGYDPVSQYYLCTEEPYRINQHPTDAEIKKAFKTVMAAFRFFKLNALSRANLLCALLVTVLLPILSICPIFAITSPYASSGKTMIAKCLKFLVEKSQACALFPKSEEELEKKVISYLLGNFRVFLFDNLDGCLESPTLCGIATSGDFMGRKLGVSEAVESVFQVMILITGKNVMLGGDLFRRVLKIVIEPDTATPEKTQFGFDPLEFVKKHRHHIISALLTLVVAFRNAGLPQQSSQTMASFGDFDKYVRQLVLWLSKLLPGWNLSRFELTDPILSIDENREDREVISDTSSLIAALYACYRDQEFTSSQVDWDKDDDSASETKRGLNKDLRDSLINCLGNPSYINARRIGRYLLDHLKDRICEIDNGTDRMIHIKLTVVGKKQNKTVFKIVKS